VRTALAQAEECGLIKISGRSRITLCSPAPQEYYEDGEVIVANSPIKLLLVIVGAPAIVIGQKIIRLQDDGTVIIGNSPVKLLLAILGDSAVVKVNRHVFRGQCVGIYLCGAALDA